MAIKFMNHVLIQSYFKLSSHYNSNRSLSASARFFTFREIQFIDCSACVSFLPVDHCIIHYFVPSGGTLFAIIGALVGVIAMLFLCIILAIFFVSRCVTRNKLRGTHLLQCFHLHSQVAPHNAQRRV